MNIVDIFIDTDEKIFNWGVAHRKPFLSVLHIDVDLHVTFE